MQNKWFEKCWKPTSILPKPVLCCVKMNGFNNVDNTNVDIKSNAPLFGLTSCKVWKNGLSVLGLNVKQKKKNSSKLTFFMVKKLTIERYSARITLSLLKGLYIFINV